MPSASVIIPTHNRAALLGTTLESLRGATLPAGWQFDILVVDNASRDATAEVVENAASRSAIPVRRIVEPVQGASAARNRGLQSVSSEWIVFLDDDILMDRDWFLAFADAVAAHAPDCVIGPVEPWFEEPPAAWLTPMMLDFVTSRYSRRGPAAHFIDARQAHEFPGGNCAVRRDAALSAGGFDCRLGRSGSGMLAGEDSEFGMRLGRLGKRILYVPACRIRHFISTRKLEPEALRARWKGAGAARRVIEALDGNRATLRALWREATTTAKARAKSALFQVLGRQGEALHHELRALYAWGYLTASPPSERRRWPPLPLGSA